MTSAERADYIKNNHRYIELYMSIPVKVSFLTKLKRLFK
jgi:hypothetical protein